MAKQVSTETLRNLIKTMKIGEPIKIQFEGIEFEVIEYLSVERKRLIIELIIQNAFVKDTRGIDRLDEPIKEAMTNFFIAREYTNFSVMDDPFEMYDALKSTGLMEVIRDSVGEDIELLENMLHDRICEEHRLQELDTNIGHKLESTVNVINSKLAEGINTLKNFNPGEQLGLLTSFMNVEDNDKLQDIQDKKGEKNGTVKVDNVNDKIDKLVESVEK